MMLHDLALLDVLLFIIGIESCFLLFSLGKGEADDTHLEEGVVTPQSDATGRLNVVVQPEKHCTQIKSNVIKSVIN